MAKIRIKVSGVKQQIQKFKRIQAAISPAKTDKVIKKVAWIVHRRLVQKTPKKYTGNTRKSWKVTRKQVGRYSVLNTSKVMRFLEYGTKAHGAKGGGFLFIPLNRRTAMAGVSKVMQANKSSSGKPPYRIGKDFIFTKRVKGIKARGIVKAQASMTKNTLTAAMRLYIRKSTQ
tara:strand:+ start:15924 stop:16442 length:519 start_codon:yes stop_codon:yes gene_type:complete